MLLMATGCATAASPSTEQQIRDLEQQQAREAIAGNRAALEQIFAPEFRVINPLGGIATKQQLLDILAGGGPSPYVSATYETQSVSVRGDMAWSLGLETVVLARDALGSKAGQTVQRRILNVWERQGGQWRLVMRQTTNVAPP
jgi:hypothetical protein